MKNGNIFYVEKHRGKKRGMGPGSHCQLVQEKSYTERKKNVAEMWQTGVVLENGANRTVKEVRCQIIRTKEELLDLP